MFNEVYSHNLKQARRRLEAFLTTDSEGCYPHTMNFTDLRITPEELFKVIEASYPDAEIDFTEVDTNGWQGDTWVLVTANGRTFDMAYGAYRGELGLQVTY